MYINTPNRNVNNPLCKRSIVLDIIENYFPIIKKIHNSTLNNFIQLFSFNEKNKLNERSKFYVELKKINPQKIERNLPLESNQKKIKSLENELFKKSFETSPTIETIKSDINKSIINASKIDKPYVKELVNDKIIKKQNELIDCYTSQIHNIKLTEDKEKLKKDIAELKLEIKITSKKLGVSYFEKKHAILESSDIEIDNAVEIKEKNEMLKSLINLQTSIKNLLIIELENVKSKMHNITLDDYTRKSINQKNSKTSEKLTEEKKNETLEELIIKKDLITYDEDNTPIYHDESHDFDFDDYLEFKSENGYIENDKKLIFENHSLYNLLNERDKDTYDYSVLVENLIIDNNKENIIRELQEKLNTRKQTMAAISHTSLSSGYCSDNESNDLAPNIEVNKKKAPQIADRLVNKSPLAAKGYSHTHRDQCLSAGIPTASTPEKLKQKQEEIKAKIKVKS